MSEDLGKYTNADGSIDWGQRAMDQLKRQGMLNDDNQSLIINNSSLINNNSSRQRNGQALINNQPKKPLKLEELTVFKLADELSDLVWDVVSEWDWFAKKTVGDQVVRSADSIGANVAEGYGRYFFGEYLLFLYYARGSLFETINWKEKARKRGLINDNQLSMINDILDKLPLELNKVIKIVKGESNKLKWQGKKRR